VALLLVLTACSRSFSTPSTQAVVVTPGAASAAPGERLDFTLSGGTEPYSATLSAGSLSTASIDGATLRIQVTTQGSRTDRVQVRDANGRRAPELDITVGPELSLVPAVAVVAARGTLRFSALGGKPPYLFALTDPADGGATLDPHSGDLLAGATNGSLKVRVLDAVGQAQTALVQVTAGLAIFPDAVSLVPGQRQQFQAIGGQPPYTWRLLDGQGAPVTLVDGGLGDGGLDGNGTLQLPHGLPAGELRVEVTDGLTQATAQVHVQPSVGIAVVGVGTSDPLSFASGTELDLVPVGGVAPFAVQFTEKGNLSGATLTAAGHYVAGPNPAQTDHLFIRDGAGGESELAIHVLGPRIFRVNNAGILGVPAPEGGWFFVHDVPYRFGGDGQVRRGAPTDLSSPIADVGDFNRDGQLDLLVEASLGTSIIKWGSGSDFLPGPNVGPTVAGAAVFTQAFSPGGALLVPSMISSVDPSVCPSGLASGPLAAFFSGSAACNANPGFQFQRGKLVRAGAVGSEEFALALMAPSPSGGNTHADLYASGTSDTGVLRAPSAPIDSFDFTEPVISFYSNGDFNPFARTTRIDLGGRPAVFITPADTSPNLYAVLPGSTGMTVLTGAAPAGHTAWTGVLQGPGRTALVIDQDGAEAWTVDLTPTPALATAKPVSGIPAGDTLEAAGDFDQDGAYDLALLHQGTVYFAMGSGAGGIPTDPESARRPGSRFATTVPPDSLVAADLNGDGGVDLVFAGGSSVAIMRGLGDVDSGRPLLAVGPTLSAPSSDSALGVAELAPGDRRIVLIKGARATVIPVSGSRARPVSVDFFGSGSGGFASIQPDAIVRLSGQDHDVLLHVDAESIDGGHELTVQASQLEADGGLSVRTLLDAPVSNLGPSAVGVFDFDGQGAPDLVVVRSSPVAPTAGAVVDVAAGVAGGFSPSLTSTPIAVPADTLWLTSAFDPVHRQVLLVGAEPSTLFVVALGKAGQVTTTIPAPTLPTGEPLCTQFGSRITAVTDLRGDGQAELVLGFRGLFLSAGVQACASFDDSNGAALVVVPLVSSGGVATPTVTRISEGLAGAFVPVVLADLNKDGRVDVAVFSRNSQGPHVQIFSVEP
jgi:hypothetical protein